MSLNLLSTSSAGSDRRLNLLLAVSILLAAFMIVGAVIAIPKILSNADTTEQLRNSSELTACRAVFRAEVDQAGADLQVARAELDVLTNAGLEAGARRDLNEMNGIVAKLAPARDHVTGAVTELQSSTERYGRQVALSLTDPAEFLDMCRTNGPG